MDLCTEFKAHERECHRMAAETKDRRTKATWTEMAERWAKAAENQASVEKQALAHRRQRATSHRQSQRYGWMTDAIA